MNEYDDHRDKKQSRLMRIGSFVGGCGFLILAAADAMLDPFPGPETFFAGTGVALLTLALTGKPPKGKEE